MASRANWEGFLLVTFPVALYLAASESEKISFNQLNKQTGHRIKHLKLDADTGGEVPNEDIVKGYMLDKETLEVSKQEFEEITLESARIIEIDEFVEKAGTDLRYLISPDGVGHDAFAIIGEMNQVATGRVVLTNHEHIIALEPLEKGLVDTLLRYPNEVRSKEESLDEIQDVKATKDMLDLAERIVKQKSGAFEPEKIEDRYENRAGRPHQRQQAHPSEKAPARRERRRPCEGATAEVRRLSGRCQGRRRRPRTAQGGRRPERRC